MRTRPLSVRSRITGATFGTSATLIREGVGSRNEFGEWVPGAAVKTPIRVTAQPPGGPKTWTQFQRYVEEGGIRLSGAIVFWTVTPLQAAGDGTVGDVILYDGTRYRVRVVERWQGYDTALAEWIEPQPQGE